MNDRSQRQLFVHVPTQMKNKQNDLCYATSIMMWEELEKKENKGDSKEEITSFFT